ANVAPVAGSTAVVFHSIAFQYFPPRSQARIAAHMAAIGGAAGAAAPRAWLRFEMGDPPLAPPPPRSPPCAPRSAPGCAVENTGTRSSGTPRRYCQPQARHLLPPNRRRHCNR
ncbi:MAG: DUF2332 family protein, partial [Sandarakinorhabdus sp.]|nr:DUF2332 family protein [Sandarakinorhabdus sp.]